MYFAYGSWELGQCSNAETSRRLPPLALGHSRSWGRPSHGWEGKEVENWHTHTQEGTHGHTHKRVHTGAHTGPHMGPHIQGCAHISAHRSTHISARRSTHEHTHRHSSPFPHRLNIVTNLVFTLLRWCQYCSQPSLMWLHFLSCRTCFLGTNNYLIFHVHCVPIDEFIPGLWDS